MQIFDKSRNLLNVDISKAFASGGEGSICQHPLNPKLVLKIYHQPRDKKLEDSLIELNKLPPEFIKPEEIFYTQTGKIAGFSMKYVDLNKFTILKKIFNNTFCLQNGFDQKVKFKIYQKLKSLIETAHNLGIYVGDLNPYNILVNKSGDVIMLDVDSYGTKSKPHNGVLLEDIRDWVQHPRVDHSTDKWAFDVLTFWMFTFVHPFRGTYDQHKTLEERIVKGSSIISQFPVGIPKCYQPFKNVQIIDQFKEVFHNGKRFLVDLTGQPQIIQVSTISQPAVVDSNQLYIRRIESDVQNINVSSNFLGLKKNGIWYVYSVKDFGVYNQLYTISDADELFVGHKNVLYQKENYIWQSGQKINNIDNLHNLKVTQDNSIFMVSEHLDKCEVLDIDNILNLTVLKTQTPIYVKSLFFGDQGVYQNIGDKKWILDFTGSTFNIIKTQFNIKNVYKRGKYVLIEHVDQNKTRYTLCKINGLNLEVGCDLSEWKYFDVKQDFIFIPEDGKINLINPNNHWKIVSEIECQVSTFDSKIYHTNSGMIVLSGSDLYLVNKK